MFIFKKLIFLIFLILISGCTLNNFEKIQNINDYFIDIDTPNDKHNLYFKETLKRFFNVNGSKTKYILKARITFESTKTLSSSGQNILKSTKARVNYQLTNKITNIVVKSGSMTTFPTLSSSSNSLYSKEKSIEHIKERLTKSSAKTLYTRIKMIIRGLR